jgi:hypothetical protein
MAHCARPSGSFTFVQQVFDECSLRNLFSVHERLLVCIRSDENNQLMAGSVASFTGAITRNNSDLLNLKKVFCLHLK